jgi:hypothetical protein
MGEGFSAYDDLEEVHARLAPIDGHDRIYIYMRRRRQRKIVLENTGKSRLWGKDSTQFSLLRGTDDIVTKLKSYYSRRNDGRWQPKLNGWRIRRRIVTEGSTT